MAKGVAHIMSGLPRSPNYLQFSGLHPLVGGSHPQNWGYRHGWEPTTLTTRGPKIPVAYAFKPQVQELLPSAQTFNIWQSTNEAAGIFQYVRM